MSSNVGIIFDNITSLLCHFLKNWKVKRVFELEMRSFCDIIHYAVMSLLALAVKVVAMPPT